MVKPELRETATALYHSNMGIGWPLQAIFGMALVCPYPTAVWASNALIKHAKGKLSAQVT